ncbi:MAG TPA: 4'-phosphopantetheinyl transferase superfamily protein [Microlunatus sp.]
MTREITVWIARPDTDLGATHLSTTDTARAEGFRRSDDRRRFVTGRAMINDLACDFGLLPRRLRIEPRPVIPGEGKPWLVADDGRPLPHISLSHSGAHVVLAWSLDAEVGVDVETSTVLTGRDAAGFLGPTELSDELDAPALLRTFVRKEAVLKAIGLGLAVDPRRLVITPPDRPPEILSFDSPRACPVRIVDLALGGGATAALAVCGTETPRTRVLCRVVGDRRS